MYFGSGMEINLPGRIGHSTGQHGEASSMTVRFVPRVPFVPRGRFSYFAFNPESELRSFEGKVLTHSPPLDGSQFRFR